MWKLVLSLSLVFFLLGIFSTGLMAQRGVRIPPQSYGFTHYQQVPTRGTRQRAPATTLPAPRNLPLYNPYFSNQFGPLYEPYEEPCYYNEDYGMWIGPCNTSLDTPGYSITVPNQIRR